ncbi:MAG: hypothetical protein JWR27_3089 [Aeromicrobium sp.]|jgi:hypothetical protein|nr:hypothetical protein [Aeromicrobium sp.]
MSESSIETEAEPQPQTVDATGYGPEDVLGNPSPDAGTKRAPDTMS